MERAVAPHRVAEFALEFAAAEMPTVASDAESCSAQAKEPTAQMIHMMPLPTKKRRVLTFAVARAVARQRQAAATERIAMMSAGSISRKAESGRGAPRAAPAGESVACLSNARVHAHGWVINIRSHTRAQSKQGGACAALFRTQSHIRRESVAGEWASRRARQGFITEQAPFVTLLQARHQWPRGKHLLRRGRSCVTARWI